MWESAHKETTMHILKIVLWSGICVGLGIALALTPVGGLTPVQHAQRQWRQNAPRLEPLKEGAEDLVDEVKKKVAPGGAPVERHTDADRDAVNRLIAKRPSR